MTIIPSLKQQTIAHLQRTQIGLGPVSEPGKRWVKLNADIVFIFQKEPENTDMQLTLFLRRLQTERVPSPLNNKRKLRKKII